MPQPVRAGQAAAVQFFVHDPWKDRPVSSYNIVHEKLFHAFVVSEDLQFFRHAHPTLAADGMFQLPIVFPKPGMYRVLGDFYPAGATPQLNARTLFVPGDSPAPVQLTRDYSPKAGENMNVAHEGIVDAVTPQLKTCLNFVGTKLIDVQSVPAGEPRHSVALKRPPGPEGILVIGVAVV